MPMLADDTVRVTFMGQAFAQAILFDLSYRCTVGNAVISTAAALDELNAQIVLGGVNSIVTEYLAALPAQYTLNEIRSQVIRPTRSAFRAVGMGGTPGTHAMAATVACDSAAINRRTDLAGRNQVSVLKVGPCPDGASAAGLLTVAYTGIMNTLALATVKTLVLPVSTIQLRPTILSPTGFASLRDLTNWSIGAQSRVMVRRVVGRGI